MPWYGRRTFVRYGRVYRRRLRRYFIRRARKKGITSRSYASKQKMDVLADIAIGQGNQFLNTSQNIANIIPQLSGWGDISSLYTAFRITFIKIELNVSRQSDTGNERQLIFFTFWPGLNNANRSLQQINSSNIKGYAGFGTTKSKKLLWKSTGAVSNLPGYGMPIAISQLNTITGTIQFRNEMTNYLAQAAVANIIVGVARITLYIEFYNSLV